MRTLCLTCRKARQACYCDRIKPFSSGPRFVILIHPKENRKRVGTGRLTHLCLKNSVLIDGIDFTDNSVVNALIADPKNFAVVLYPGVSAVDVTTDTTARLEALVPSSKQLVIFVIDGSWFCAKKMMRVSANLKMLPQISFTPSSESIYAIRRQPHPHCLSTLEAVYFIIHGAPSERWPGETGHENLLEVFRFMIHKQLSHVTTPGQRAMRGNRALP